ncbi:MAG: Hint domain-containing protein [Albidovulum sp.]|uniref:Hint domain-containing protein n=1 Tax=Albidovulum sp. TaxID=1872424 RepID=UPI001D9E601F|nr:Hint domain-containing protein [Paracoccaceae bacterium]
MSYPHVPIGRLSTDVFNSPVPHSRTLPQPAPADPGPLRSTPLTRRYEIAYLDAEGRFETCTRLAPAIPEFEEAFSAFARGTVIATTEGPVAVEDLVPGMEALTAEGRAERITWIGSMTLFPQRAMPGMPRSTLTRITADAFGVGRPMPDLVLGPRARILVRDARCRFATGVEAAYAPACAFADGVSIIEVSPVAALSVFHIVLERQGSIRAAGLEIESFHPGARMSDGFDPQVAQVFLTLFPHMRSIADFGALAHPRMTAAEVEAALHA